MNIDFESVSANNWVLFSLITTIQIVIVGSSWSWMLPRFERFNNIFIERLIGLARNVLFGLPISLFLTLVLAEIGIYRPTVVWASYSAVLACGIALGYRHLKDKFAQHLIESIPGMFFFAIGMAAIMNLSDCGEWIVGGWDPGVYQNQGLSVAQTGTFHPAGRYCYEELTEDEFRAFTRGGDQYRECFTGIPVNPHNRRFEHYFFRLTPSFTALLTRAGGLRAATRINYVAGFLTVIMFIAMMASLSFRRSHIIFSTILLMTQPIWLYHLHIPSTEMLHLFLIFGIGLLLIMRSNICAAVLISFLIFLAIVNRLSFLPFAAIFILTCAWLDIERKDRKIIYAERGLYFTALLAGAFFNIIVCSITLTRLSDVFAKLIIFTVALSGLTVFIDILGPRLSGMKLIQKKPYFISVAILSAAIMLLLLVYLYQDSNFIMRCWRFLARIIPGIDAAVGRSSLIMHRLVSYSGGFVTLLSICGALLLFANRSSSVGAAGRGFVFFTASVLAILIFNSYIAPLYPWASRRFLPYIVPLLSITAGYLLSRVFVSRIARPWISKVIAGSLFLLAIASNAKMSTSALACTEFNGISEILSEISRQIAPDDIVLVDHSKWGTPLTFIYGKQVLNGQYFFERNKEEGLDTMKVGIAALRRMHGNQKRILMLTSTQTAALNVYPVKLENAELILEGRTTFDEVIHSKRAASYASREVDKHFRLFHWTP
jgi:hypothetical protein